MYHSYPTYVRCMYEKNKYKQVFRKCTLWSKNATLGRISINFSSHYLKLAKRHKNERNTLNELSDAVLFSQC